jgi:hypothetical protein
MHRIEKISKIGIYDHWEIISDTKLNDEEITAIVEYHYPSAGYGVSRWTTPISKAEGWIVSVWSYGSCD